MPDREPDPDPPQGSGGRLRRWLATSLATSLTAQVLLIALVTRAALALVPWVGLRVLDTLSLYPGQVPDRFLIDHTWIDGWARWDTAHYVAVASLGYGDEESPSHNGGLGFFPLYPMLMKLVAWPMPGDTTEAQLAAAAVLISNVAFLGAVPLFAAVVAHRAGPNVARTATLLLCVSPFSYVFMAGYSESLFLLLLVATFWLADRDRWWAASLLSALATATRLVGLALPPALLLLAWRRGRPLQDRLATIVLAPAGVLVWFVIVWVRFDDPLAYFTAQRNWGGWGTNVRVWAERLVTDPVSMIAGDPRNLVILLNLVLAGLWIGTLPWVWRRLDPGIALLTTLLVMQTAMTWVSLGRYLLPAIGGFIAFAALLERPGWRGWPRDLVLVTSTVAMGTLALLFALGFWAI